MKPTVLVYSADPDFLLVFGHILSAAGFQSTPVRDLAGIEQARGAQPIALVMDCQARDRGAAKLCARLKASQAGIAIAALMAPKADALHAEMLTAGVDESFARPFAPERLLTWLRTQLENDPVTLETDTGDMVHGDFRLERRTHRIVFRGEEVALPPIEFRLLRHMMADPGAVFSREALIKAAWPENAENADPRAVDVHVARLRKRLSSAIGQDVIRTVRSAGYAFAPAW